MQKELNPELFGEGLSRSRLVEPSGGEDRGLQQVLAVDQKIAELRGEVRGAVEQMNDAMARIADFMRASQGRFEKLQTAIAVLERNDQAIALDNTQKLSQLNQKLGERKVLDLKVQEMIDRHNSVLKSYELRLSQLQKLIGEREQQILATQGALNEAKRELARLKRL